MILQQKIETHRRSTRKWKKNGKEKEGKRELTTAETEGKSQGERKKIKKMKGRRRRTSEGSGEKEEERE